VIHHVSLGTNDLRRAKPFYDAVFAILGLRLVSEDGLSIDYGVGEVMFSLETPVDGKPASVGNGVHIAFSARDPDMVDEFYRVALENGGTDDGPPGLRRAYNPNYYGAFVRDPDGNKIEAVTHAGRKDA
jgi:catechol 2,3-dioxygenase-like lactoylglutathione lyase family enzyme